MNVVSSEQNRYNSRPLNGGTGQSNIGMRYPSPFFDVAQQFLPSDQSQLHKWCRYYFLTNPIINAACSKMAEYPVTPLLFETEDPNLQKTYRGLERVLKLRDFQVEVGLDYFVYGNAFVSVFFPMTKYLICEKCGERHRASTSRSRYKWRNLKFHLSCRACKHEGYAKEFDQYLQSIRDIRLIRWNPENIKVKHNEITGQSKYYFKLPKSTINDIKVGDKDTIETIPSEFIEAARKSKALLFNKENIYHLKRPTIAQKDQGWGTPLLYPVLKDAFYLQVMKKAQESVLMEHIVPLRMIYPGPSTGGNDGPYGSYNLSNWKAKVDAEINTWKMDNNYIPVLPVNVGFQQFGGNARALMMYQEMKMVSEQMLAGAGIPQEFIFGGLQWSGSNTSLRALENMLLGYNRQRHELIIDFIIKKIARFMRWPLVEARFEKFKMADDLQRSMFYLQLNQAQKISDRRLMEEVGESFDLENERMSSELKTQLTTNRKMQMATADIQGEASLKSSRYQAKAQEIQQRSQMELQTEMQEEQEKQQQKQQEMQAQAQQPSPEEQQAQQAQLDQQTKLTELQMQKEVAKAEAAKSRASKANAERRQETMETAQSMAETGMTEAGADQEADRQDANDKSREQEEGQKALPTGMESPLQQGQGGVDVGYLAKRAVSYLKTVKREAGEEAMYQELQGMQTSNNSLYQLVVQMLNDRGSQENPLDGMQNPNPTGQATPGNQVVG
jgi:hypothetical protein